MKLLVVDDEYFARQGIMDGVNWEVLEYDEVLQAASYTQAVEIMEKTPVDVLLCDIEMPDESGLELIAWVNEHRPDTECIILSCHDEFDFARQAVRMDCMDYILKPARFDFVTQVLKKACVQAAEKQQKNLFQDYGRLYIDNLAQSKKGETVDVVEKVTHYIDEHLSEDLSVRMLANMAYVSPDHLTRSFKKRLRVTVSDYILNKRMALAGELLKDTGLTVTMVSDTVGFGNYSYFTEQFKKYYGITPREYQAARRKDKE